MTEKPKRKVCRCPKASGYGTHAVCGGEFLRSDEAPTKDAAFLAMLEALKSALPSEQEGVYEISASVVDEVVAQAEAVRK